MLPCVFAQISMEYFKRLHVWSQATLCFQCCRSRSAVEPVRLASRNMSMTNRIKLYNSFSGG
jgi:hypothetical protein